MDTDKGKFYRPEHKSNELILYGLSHIRNTPVRRMEQISCSKVMKSRVLLLSKCHSDLTYSLSPKRLLPMVKTC